MYPPTYYELCDRKASKAIFYTYYTITNSFNYFSHADSKNNSIKECLLPVLAIQWRPTIPVLHVVPPSAVPFRYNVI